ncbi:hypothetical protein GWE18_36700 [Bradyrhizobium sp. CSA112]|uniref:hypothetical protein n=1 Tax=Bradyrhizobium sp. CSA112 TaxID=2699170 RepID=UPI0023B12C2B|nr:hypothetical protein [Bradyrhizobium sp. CSA112]MDE5458253.1 hypothetical protein [Bradyrhizobium sp. CSA112]
MKVLLTGAIGFIGRQTNMMVMYPPSRLALCGTSDDIEYVEGLSGGFRFDDPMFSMTRPEPVTMFSPKNAARPSLADREL